MPKPAATIYGGLDESCIYYLLVTGDRDWIDFDLVLVAIKAVKEWCEDEGYELHIVHGGARGADTAADVAADKLQIPCHRYPAPWDRIGRKAGPLRNKLMPQRHPINGALVVHDDLDNSSGTKDMYNKLRRLKVECEFVSH